LGAGLQDGALFWLIASELGVTLGMAHDGLLRAALG